MQHHYAYQVSPCTVRLACLAGGPVLAVGVTVPMSLMSKDMTTGPFGEIRDLDPTQYGDIQLLHIEHSGGKSKLESPHFESFDSILGLTDRLQESVDAVA